MLVWITKYNSFSKSLDPHILAIVQTGLIPGKIPDLNNNCIVHAIRASNSNMSRSDLDKNVLIIMSCRNTNINSGIITWLIMAAAVIFAGIFVLPLQVTLGDYDRKYSRL